MGVNIHSFDSRTGLDWPDVAKALMASPYHVSYVLPKSALPDPADSCLEPSFGRRRGQLRDWRATLPDGSCLHVLEYRSVYAVHRDRANPNDSVIRHVALDEPSLIALLPILPVLELLRVVGRALYRRGLARRGHPCAFNAGRLGARR